MLQEDQEKYGSLTDRIQAISNMAESMDRLISGLVEEIDRTRGQMFEVLENIAFYEMQGELNKKGSKNKSSRR